MRRRGAILMGILLSGLFLYFVILPSTLGIDEFLTWIPSFSLYVALDLYLVSRAVQEMRHATTPQSRLIYGLLLAALTFALVTDSLDLAWIASHLPDAFPQATDLLWYAPMVLIVAAVRSGSFAADEGSITETDDDDQVRGVPLLVYSVGFALLHLLLTLPPNSGGALLSARIVLVMVWLILFGVLNLIQNSIIQREVRQQFVDVFVGTLHRRQAACVLACQGFGAGPEQRDEKILADQRPQGRAAASNDLWQVFRGPVKLGQPATPILVQGQ